MRRRFLISALVLGLLLVTAFSLEAMFSVSPKVAAFPEFKPSMRVPAGVDVDGNRIDDRLDLEISQRVSNHTQNDPANVVVMLNGEPTQADVNAFKFAGGSVITDLWESALYGFGGHIPYGQIVAFSKSSPKILLIEKDAVCEANVAYAARQIGARPYVWSTLGLQGDAGSSIAVLDTGIDASHVDFVEGYGSGDFSKKIVGWYDPTSGSALPFDDNGHGSHCSGLAAGDGFFTVDDSGFAESTSSAVLKGTETSDGGYIVGGMMINRTGLITVSVRWSNTNNMKLTSFAIYYGDKSLNTATWTSIASVNTPTENAWYSLSYNVASVPAGEYDMYHLVAFVTTGVGYLYVMSNMSWPYLPPEDGFSAWTGLAPDSKLVGVKVLGSNGLGTSTALISGLNWVVANRVNYHITVASMSLGFDSNVSSVNTAVINLVNSGVSTIVAAGNSGSGGNYVFTPGSIDEVLTVSAMNQFDGITSYSSQGGTSGCDGHTTKPDLTAPGGSFVAVPLYSVDTNYNDAEGRWADVAANDAAPMQGTSMATPIVAGAAQVLVQALGGYDGWDYTLSQALMPKMLLSMTTTETYPNLRESGTSPTLERGGKDAQEGYGRINLDAAVDAVLKRYVAGSTVVDSLGLPPKLTDISVLGQRLCWARNVQLLSGIVYNFSLTIPAGADYDLYLYNTTGTAFGEPVILTKSTSAVAGAKESIAYTPELTGEYYVVVKRAREDTGSGQFTLTSTPATTAHLLLSVEPNQATYIRGQPVTLAVNVFNELNPPLDSTLTLTVTGPNNYYFYETQTVNVTANSVEGYKFNWNIPDVVGTYVVEVGLVPAQLTAYDSKWIEAK